MLGRIFAALLMFAGAAQAQTATQPTQNGSITITSGNNFQQIFGASDIRRSITIQNNNTTSDSCWIFFGTTGAATKAAGILLGPGGSYQRYYPYIPREAVQATCSTTGNSVYADQQ